MALIRIVGVGLFCVLLAHASFAQRALSVRVIVPAAEIREGADGRSAVTMTAFSGAVFEVLDKVGDWYWVVLPADSHGTRRAGWITAQSVEIVAGTEIGLALRDLNTKVEVLQAQVQALQPAETAALEPAVSAQQVDSVRSAPLRQVAQPRFGLNGNAVDAGTVELMAVGDITSTTAADETVNSLNLTAFVGVFATPNVEVGVSTSMMKAADLDTTGVVLGHVLFNFPNQSAIVPFISIGLGTTFGYAAIVGHPATLDVSGGFRVMMPDGDGALVIRPFFQRAKFSSDFVDLEVTSFGVAVGASLLF